MRVRDFVTTCEAANLFHVHYTSIRRWCEEGWVRYEVTKGGHFRIPREALLMKLGASPNAR